MNKKNDLYGWEKVCRYSVVQTMKSRTMKVVLAVIFILLFFSMPAVTLFNQKGGKTESTVHKVSVYADRKALQDCFEQKFTGDLKKYTFTILTGEEMEKTLQQLKKGSGDCDVLVEIRAEEQEDSKHYGVELLTHYNEKSKVKKKDVTTLAQAMTDNLKGQLLSVGGMEKEELQELLADTAYEIKTVNANGKIKEDQEGLGDSSYVFVYAYLMVTCFAALIAGSKVAELIVTEKTSKVIEYLLTSVRPLALLVGKVAGTMLIVFMMLIGAAMALAGSMLANYLLFDTKKFLPEALEKFIHGQVLQNAGFAEIVTAVAIFFLGMLFYCILAGLAGATVSKIEELAEGMKIFSFILLIGVYLALALLTMSVSSGNFSVFSTIVYDCPLSSMFIVPAYVLIGRITLKKAVISLGILAAFTGLAVYFVTKVFEHVLYHNGSTMKFKEILAIYQTKKKGEIVK